MIDSSIALGVRPATFDTGGVVNMVAQAQARRMAQETHQQNMELNAQALKTGALKQQQEQQAITDDKSARDFFSQNPHATDEEMISKLGPKVAHPIIQERYKSQESQLKMAGEKLDMFGRIAGSVKDESSFHAGVQSVLNAGLIQPEEAAQLHQQGWTPETQAYIQQHVAEGMKAKEQVDTALAQLKEKRDAAAAVRAEELHGPQLAEAEAKVSATNRQQDASTLAAAAKQGPQALASKLRELSETSPDRIKPFMQLNAQSKPEEILALGETPHEQIATGQTAKRDEQTRVNEEAMRKQGQQRLGIEQTRLKMQQEQQGFDQNGGVSKTALAAAAGDLDPATVRAMLRRNPGLISQIKQVDPNFDEASIERRYGTLKEFNSTSNSKAGGQVIALNTLIHHADLYQQVAESLKNGSFRPGNAAYNAVANAFGAAPPTQAALVGRFLAGETGKVATGGVPAEGEINGILKNLGSDASPDQIKQAGDTLLQIAAGRATPLMERVKESKLDNVVKVLGSDAQEILKRRGFDPNTMKRAAADGGMSVSYQGHVYTFTDKAKMDAFKADLGIK